MGFFERYLTLWVGICIVAGVELGHFFSESFQTLGRMEYVKVNIPVALLIWVMIIPMLLKVDLHALVGVRKYWRGVGVTLFVNWMVKPFSMALLAWVFIEGLFRPWLPADQIESYYRRAYPARRRTLHRNGLCLEPPLRWGAPFHPQPGGVECIIMIFAFAPIVGLLLGLSSITVPWGTLFFLSVALYIVIPLIIANIWRWIIYRGEHKYLNLKRTLKTLHPWSLGALLAMLVLLFGFQGEQILDQPMVIALLAVPILIQVFFNSGLAYLLNRAVRSPHCVAGPSALIGASNFFELAVAAAISLFGLSSGAALATVVGVLIEVPVMLWAVNIVNRTRVWYEQREGMIPHEACCPP